MRKIKSIFMFMMLFLGLLFGFATTPVMAVSVYYLDYGWENIAHGTTDGFIGSITYDKNNWSDGEWLVDANGEVIKGLRSFRVYSSTFQNASAYWNLTTPILLPYQISFWVDCDATGGSGYYMNFYNDTDDIVMKLNFDSNSLEYYETITGWNELYTDITNYPSYQLQLTFTWNNTNEYWFRGYNTSGGLEIQETLYGYNVDRISDISYVEFYQWDTAGDNLHYWFDDFNITTSAGESGWDTCQGGSFLVTKLFYDSIGYYNDTLSFTIQKNLLATGYYGIYNSTGSLVQSSSFNSQTFPTWYFVDPQYGTGTYYLKCGYDFGTWLMSCPFTILTSTSDIANWNVRFDKSSYNIGDEVDLFVKIPSGEVGYVNITLEESGETYFYKSYNNIYGTGNEIKFDNIFHIYNNGYCLNAWLYNDTNDVLMKHFVACVPVDIDYWTLYLDGEFTTSINNGDSVRIEGNHHYDNGYVRFMNDTDPVNGTIFSQIGIGTGDYLFDYDKFVNTSVGVERFYVYLYCDNNYLIDGIIRYVDVYDEDVLTPFTDEGWYGLPFWVPYLIGIFITLFVTMSPLIIGTYITRNSRIEKINIPPLLYVGFFFMGLIISVVMDFLPYWLPFVILFAMITYFAVTWLAGRQTSVQGE